MLMKFVVFLIISFSIFSLI